MDSFDGEALPGGDALAGEDGGGGEGRSVYPEVLYDLAVNRLANGDREGALSALEKAVAANPASHPR